MTKRLSDKKSVPTTQTSIPTTQTTNVAIEKEKKKSDKSWLVLGGLVLIVTLGAVNLFKED